MRIIEELVGELDIELQFSRCVPLLLEGGSWGRGQFGNPEAGERQPLEAATKEWLVGVVTNWEH
jgi:hypothetical protein